MILHNHLSGNQILLSVSRANTRSSTRATPLTLDYSETLFMVFRAVEKDELPVVLYPLATSKGGALPFSRYV